MPLLPSIRALSKKVSLPLLIGGIIVFYAWLVVAATRVNLPDQKNPIQFYSNQTRDDIKLVYLRALQKADQFIFLSVYGVTDVDIIWLLAEKAKLKVPVIAEYDSSASSNLKKILPPYVEARPIKSKGLMHRKIVTIDHAQTLLGSANLTASSLRHHDNLVLGIHHAPLATFLEYPDATSYCFELGGQKGQIFLLPDPTKQGLMKLLKALQDAKSKISIAMFTMTHPEITTALVQAQQRGVAVTIAADYYTAKGASKKALEILAQSGITVLSSQGRQLLHHKWAVIDDEIFIMGSANWTKAAFSKNQDFLLFLSPLDADQKRYLNRLWKIIVSESTVCQN